MKTASAFVLAVLALAGCGSTPPETEAAAALASTGAQTAPAYFMRAYTEAWNRHDAAAIAEDFYAMGMSVPEQTKSLEKTFADMVAQGYDKSTIHEIQACETGPGEAWAGMKFTRLKTDGEPLGPRDRASEYKLEWKDERGWRIVSVGGRDAGAPLECPAG